MGNLGGHSKVIMYEILGAFLLIVLLLFLRPLFVGQVASAGSPYTITVQNGTTTYEKTITPSGSVTDAQADKLYSLIIFVVILVALFVILLTMMGKI